MSKAGRKRKTGVKRVNGRISQKKVDIVSRQSETEAEVKQTVREGRARVWGIDLDKAERPESMTVVGRLYQQSRIQKHHLDAAARYEAIRDSYLRAISAPPQPGAVDLNRAHGAPTTDDARHAAFCRKAIDRHTDLMRALQEAQNVYRSGVLLAALDHIVIRDASMPHMVGDLRYALNVIAQFCGIPEDEAVAA